MAKNIETHCRNCGLIIMVRAADVKRGWGKFCSKSCKASKQEKKITKTTRHAYVSNHDFEDDGGFDNTSCQNE